MIILAMLVAFVIARYGLTLFGASQFVLPQAGLDDDLPAKTVFYRLQSSYQHDDETVNFDIVVGCSLVNHADAGKPDRFVAYRDPRVFTQATKDGGAVMQIVPDACDGQSSVNGKAPVDFMPGAIWFPKADDPSLGYGYVTERAFAAPNTALRFQGAKILPATQADWDAFQPSLKRDLPMGQSDKDYRRLPHADEIAAHAWDRPYMARWWPRITCYGVTRLRYDDARARAILRREWPADHPRFWGLSPAAGAMLDTWLHPDDTVTIAGKPARDYVLSYAAYHAADGFPTMAGGGTLADDASHDERDRYPGEIFPLEADDGIPWMTPALHGQKVINRRVTLDRAANPANPADLACYHLFKGYDDAATATLIPGYRQRQFATLIEGTPLVLMPDSYSSPEDLPEIFFGEDRDVYGLVTVGLR